MKNIASEDHKSVDLQWLPWLNSTLYDVGALSSVHQWERSSFRLDAGLR